MSFYVLVNICVMMVMAWYMTFDRGSVFASKNVYKLRYDHPIKIGEYYVGLKAIARLSVVFVAFFAVYIIDKFNIYGFNDSFKENRTRDYAAHLAVNDGLGGVVVNILIFLALLVCAFLAVKIYHAYKAQTHTQKQSDKEEIEEEKAKYELFELMYKNNEIKLPLGGMECKDDSDWKLPTKSARKILAERKLELEMKSEIH